MEIIKDGIRIEKLKEMAVSLFGNLVKAVVDINDGVMAIGGELHADEEQLLLDAGSKQKDLWGINLYTDKEGEDFIEFDSMINLRPSQNNRSRSVDDENIREKIIQIVKKLVQR